jgi:hypothetical protein
LEATLRLLQAFPDTNSSGSDSCSQSQLVRLLKAVHATDSRSHAHPQVQLACCELALRWHRHYSLEELSACAVGLAQQVCAQAVLRAGAYQQRLRAKLVHMLWKYCEALEGKKHVLFRLVAPRLTGTPHCLPHCLPPYLPYLPLIERCYGCPP